MWRERPAGNSGSGTNRISGSSSKQGALFSQAPPPLTPPLPALTAPPAHAQLLAGSLSLFKGQAAVEGLVGGLSREALATALRDFVVIAALYIPVRGARGSLPGGHGICGRCRSQVG